MRAEVALQKLHLNLSAIHWHLASNPWEYDYSSAHYYEMNEKHIDFLKDVREEF